MPLDSLFAFYIEQCIHERSEDVFEYITRVVSAHEIDEISVARHHIASESMWRMVGPYCAPPYFSPTHLRRAKRVMQVYTNDRSYRGDTPMIVMRAVAWMRDVPTGRPMFDVLNPLVARWAASRLALVLRPVGLPRRNAIVDLLYVQDGEGVVAKTVRDFVREMSVL